jgi:flagellar hook-length control protein FliK
MTTNKILDFNSVNQKSTSIKDIAFKAFSPTGNLGFASIFESSIKNIADLRSANTASQASLNTKKDFAFSNSYNSSKINIADDNKTMEENSNKYLKKIDITRKELGEFDDDQSQRLTENRRTTKESLSKNDNNKETKRNAEPTSLEDIKIDKQSDETKEILSQIASLMGISMQQLQGFLEATMTNSENILQSNSNQLIEEIGKLDSESQKVISEAIELLQKLLGSAGDNGQLKTQIQQPNTNITISSSLKNLDQNDFSSKINLENLLKEVSSQEQQSVDAQKILTQTGNIFKSMLQNQLTAGQTQTTNTSEPAILLDNTLQIATTNTNGNEKIDSVGDITSGSEKVVGQKEISELMNNGNQNNQNSGENSQKELTKDTKNADIISVASKESDSEAQSMSAQTFVKAIDSKIEVLTTKTANLNQEQIQVNQSNAKIDTTIVSEKTGKEVHVKPQEVINQVLEKAKLTITPEKSEMVLELKPESLGKISLKVATERGIVAASFIAENQQVKDIIEANMQLLKEALQKQGLAVQSFSVSVGNGNSQGSDKNNWSNQNQSSQRINIQKALAFDTNGTIEINRTNAQTGIWGESRINITA